LHQVTPRLEAPSHGIVLSGRWALLPPTSHNHSVLMSPLPSRYPWRLRLPANARPPIRPESPDYRVTTPRAEIHVTDHTIGKCAGLARCHPVASCALGRIIWGDIGDARRKRHTSRKRWKKRRQRRRRRFVVIKNMKGKRSRETRLRSPHEIVPKLVLVLLDTTSMVLDRITAGGDVSWNVERFPACDNRLVRRPWPELSNLCGWRNRHATKWPCRGLSYPSAEHVTRDPRCRTEATPPMDQRKVSRLLEAERGDV
jgi:hypothetical protein